MALPTLLPAAVFFLLPVWRNRKQAFTITVTPEYLQSAAAHSVLLRYRAAVSVLGLAAFAAELLFVGLQQPWGITLAPLAEVLGLFVAWAWAWDRTMPHRMSHPVVRMASLNSKPVLGTTWWLTTLTAWLPLGAVAVYLRQHWSQIPRIFPVHWGMDGQPNGWERNTVGGVLWPLLLGALLVLLMAVLGWMIARHAPVAPNTALLKMTLNLLRIVAWFVAILFSGTALLPLLHHAGPEVGWGAGISVGFALLIVVYAIVTVVKNNNFESLQNATSESYWKWGLFYYNPGDAALFVPKRLGYGYTMNMAHPAGWLLLAVVVALAAIAIVFALHSR
jgi:uncharacterized membrane protein